MIDTKRLAGWLIVAAVLYLPLLTWIPLTTANSHAAVGQTPYWLLWIVGLLVLACWIGERDGILGLIVGYAALRTLPASWWGSCNVQIPFFPYPSQIFSISCGPFPQGSLEVALMIAIGSVLILAVQGVPSAHVRLALLTAATIQGIYMTAQWQGWDPIWGGIFTTSHMRIVGTVGQESYAGAILGMIAPLASPILWPIAVWLLYQASNATGLIALVFGAGRRFGLSWGILGVIGILGLSVLSWMPPESLAVRMRVWQAAMQDQTWWTWLIGHGWGAWFYRMPHIHPQAGVGEVFLQAHNEPIQMYYDGGMILVLLVGWWIWSKRECWVGLWGGAALAVMLSTLGFFTFHAAIPGLIGAVIVGAAIRAKQEDGEA